MSQGQSIAELEAQIEDARARLADTVDELVARAQPSAIIAREKESLRASFYAATRDEQGDLRLERIAAVLGAVAAVSIGLGLLRRARG
ncbi:MAG TPA: DUF3618 domain-containing protein [Dermatophilaceae bacterium]|nr:DUF3618 domain-containing protein [Dermatophilaceae bacterium]